VQRQYRVLEVGWCREWEAVMAWYCRSDCAVSEQQRQDTLGDPENEHFWVSDRAEVEECG
jgi:hypothetical protein